MAYEMSYDTSWTRVTAGHYVNASGAEVYKSNSATWTLTGTMNPDRYYRTLRAAKAAAEED